MKTQKKNVAKSIEDVISFNVGMKIEDFLNTEKEYEIEKLDTAAALIKRFIKEKKPITIVGDYDADGICSSSILYLALKENNANVKIRLPRRFSEGYGLSEKIVDEIDSGLLITVDNGIAAADAIKKAKDKGLTVIVTDHHLAPESGILPDADILIDPKAIENSATFNGYCGAGLAYKLSMLLIDDMSKIAPKILGLAAIATIADVVPLVEENRKIVKDGLKVMTNFSGRTTGLSALLQAYNLDKYLCAKDIAFKIGPALNAPGRLYDDGAMRSFELLTYNSRIDKAKELADGIVEINEMRKEIKEKSLDLIKQNIENNCLFGDYPLIIYEPELKEGILGICAGKLAEEYNCPCIVLTDSETEGLLKGSARSRNNVNIKELLDKNSEFLAGYGGHAEAAGLSLLLENFDEFRTSMIQSIDPPSEDEDSSIVYDLEISSKDISKVLDELEKFAPFGQGNPEPIFLINNFALSPGLTGYYRTMGADGQHIKLLGMDKTVALGFDMTEKYLSSEEPKEINVVGTLSKNFFMGSFTNQIEMIDFESVFIADKKTNMAKILAEMAKTRRDA